MKDPITPKVRDSNLEAMRVFCMVSIVLSHYVFHGGLLDEDFSMNQALAQLLKIGGKLGVTCFVLISAYFLVDAKFKFQSMIKLCLETSFYAVLVLIVKYCVCGGGYSVTEIFKSLFAPIYGLYWFPTAYIGMYVCFPLLNIIVDKLGKNLLKIQLLFSLVFGLTNFLFVGSGFLYSDFTWFLYLYFWGAYIRRYRAEVIESHSMVIGIGSILAIWMSSAFVSAVGNVLESEAIAGQAFYFSGITSPLIITAGIGLFVNFKNMTIPYNRVINYLGSLTFPVYLIHDNPYFREIMWKKLFRTEVFFQTNPVILLFHMILVVTSLFLVAAVLEFIRKKCEKALFSVKGFACGISRINNLFEF